MPHPDIKEKHPVTPNFPTFKVLWNGQELNCYFDRFVIENNKDKIRFQSFLKNEYDEHGHQEFWGHYVAKEFSISSEKIEKINQYFENNGYPISCFGYDKILYINDFDYLTDSSKWDRNALSLEEMVDDILEILWSE